MPKEKSSVWSNFARLRGSVQSVSSNSSSPAAHRSSNLQDLIAEQLAVAERLLALNREIAAQALRAAPPPQSYATTAGDASTYPMGREDTLVAGPATPLLRNSGSVPFSETATEGNKRDNKTLGGDVDRIRDQVHMFLAQAPGGYNVEDHYKKGSCWTRLIMNDCFRASVFFVIGLNILWIGIETDANKADVLTKAPFFVQVIENTFCAFFSLEILARLLAFKNPAVAFQDGWFRFDSLLVVMMVLNDWVTPILYHLAGASVFAPQQASVLRVLRLVRLTRVARVARLLKLVPELSIFIKGLGTAVRSVFSTMFLLGLLIYIFAIIFVQMLSGTDVAVGCFENVAQGMNCLLLDAVFADQATFITQMLEVSWMSYFVLLIFLCIATLTVLNMLIGVMCEVLGDVAQQVKEERALEDVKEHLKTIMRRIDTDEDEMVSKEEFKTILLNPDAVRRLQDVNVDVVALVDFADFIFENKEEMTLDQFMLTVLQFRSENSATVKDVVETRKFIGSELADLKEVLRGRSPSFVANSINKGV